MKALKIIGIIVAVIIAAILIIPLFAPSTTEVSASTEIALEPSQIFPSVASFSDRPEWDPWLNSDTTAQATIESKPGYVGSTYAWEGEATGTGKMEVTGVEENRQIQSSLWFGDVETPATVTWDFAQVDGGTQVTWSYTQDTKYPFQRLGMMIGAGFLEKSFNDGLSRLKEYLEANPPATSSLGPITMGTLDAFDAIVAGTKGSMDEMGQLMGQLFGTAYEALAAQGLQVSGPAFSHYLEYDESTGISTFVAGFPVTPAGSGAGDAMARSYPEMKVVEAIHTGPYDNLVESYMTLEAYMEEHGLEPTGEAFEIYLVSMEQQSDPALWKTRIAYPLR